MAAAKGLKMNNEMKSWATLKEVISTGVRRPLFTSGKWQIIELLVMFYFYLYIFFSPKTGKGAHDLWMIVSQSLTFSVRISHNRISHPTHSRTYTYNSVYKLLLLENEFFFFSLRVHFFVVPAIRTFPVPEIAYLFFTPPTIFSSRDKKVFSGW